MRRVERKTGPERSSESVLQQGGAPQRWGEAWAAAVGGNRRVRDGTGPQPAGTEEVCFQRRGQGQGQGPTSIHPKDRQIPVWKKQPFQ